MFQIIKKNQAVMQESLADKIKAAKSALQTADAIVIGAGAGLSDAGGIRYSGSRFTDNFPDFIQKYGMTDMYTAGFYPFQTQEEKWAYWARHIHLNRYAAPVGEVYTQLLELVRDQPHFVITTNVDAQFYRAGFDQTHIWAVQGDYGKLQCGRGCHDRLYDNQELVQTMLEQTKDCKIPSGLVPKCPVCGGGMEVGIRKDMYFVQDAQWYEEAGRYEAFLNRVQGQKVVFLELGVGYNTPTIIRLPFEQMTAAFPNATLVRVNLSYPDVPSKLKSKSICIQENIAEVISDIRSEFGF